MSFEMDIIIKWVPQVWIKVVWLCLTQREMKRKTTYSKYISSAPRFSQQNYQSSSWCHSKASFSPTSLAHSVSEDESELTPDSDTTEPLLTPRYQGSLRSSKKSASPKDSLKCPSLRVNLQTDSSSCDKKTASRDPFPSLCDITSLCENEYETHTSDSRSQATAAQTTENSPLINLPQFNGSNWYKSSFVLRFFNTMYNKLRKSRRKKIWEKYTAMSWFSCTVNNIAFIVVNVTCTSLIQFRLWKTSLDLREDKFGSFVCLSVWGCLFLDLNTISYIIFNELSLISEVVYSVKWRKMGQFSEVTIVICLTWDTMYHDISWSIKLLGKSSPS